MNTSENKSFCAMAWVHIAGHTDGSPRLCCMSSRFIKNSDNENFNLGTDSIDTIFNSEDYTSIRKDMLEGKLIAGCESCYQSEKYSGSSHRTRYNNNWKNNENFKKKLEQSINEKPVDNTIEYFDIRYGNLCNLSCRYCYSEASSQYNKEIKNIIEITNTNLFRPIDTDLNSWYQTDIFKQNFYAQVPNLTSYYVAGGEPTLNDSVYETMKFMVDSGHSEHITLQISTNVTNTKNDFYSLLPHFKKIVFLASIDGVGAVQEYMRYPSNWEQIDRNFRKVVGLNANTLITITPVLQKINLEYITELFEYAENFNRIANRTIVTVAPIILTQPSYFDFSYLPREYKQHCMAKIDEWLKTCKFQDMLFHSRIKTIREKCLEDYDSNENLETFFEYIDIFDTHRNQRLADINPTLEAMRHK